MNTKTPLVLSGEDDDDHVAPSTAPEDAKAFAGGDGVGDESGPSGPVLGKFDSLPGGHHRRRQQPQLPSDPRVLKANKFMRMLQLNQMFGYFGLGVANLPYAFIISSVIIFAFTAGCAKIHFRDRVRDGYTPSTSPSRAETDVLRAFYGLKSDPIVTMVMMLAKDNGTVHRPEHLAEILRVHNLIKKNVSVTLDDGRSLVFMDFCGEFCGSNGYFEFFANEAKNVYTGKAAIQLDFPISKYYGVNLHFEQNLFSVHTEANRTLDDPEMPEWERKFASTSNISHVELVQLVYHGETINGMDEDALARWEMSLYHFLTESYTSDLLEIRVLGSEIVDYEMNKYSQRMGPFAGLGYVFMIIFAVTTVGISQYYYHGLRISAVFIAFVGTMCSVLSVGVTLGIYGITGMRVNSVMLIMPFLTLGIGVNDAFIMIHAFFRYQTHSPGTAALMKNVYSDVGPSITITTLTNVVTFLIGATTPTAEIQLFCIAAAMSLGYSYIFTLIFLGPVLAVVDQSAKRRFTLHDDEVTTGAGGGEGGTLPSLSLAADDSVYYVQKESSIKKTMDKFLITFTRIYTSIICSPIFHVLNSVVYLTVVGFTCYGAYNISARLDTEKILPREAIIRRPHELMAHKVWYQYYPLQVFVTKPFNISDVTQMTAFDSMMTDFYSLPLAKGPEYTINWLDDYKAYYDDYHNNGFDFNFDDEETVERKPSPTGYDLSLLDDFLGSLAFRHHTTFLHASNASSPQDRVIKEFNFIVVYEKVETWDDRIEIMIKWRKLAAQYKDTLGAVVWEANGMFVDQMLSLKDVSIRSATLTLGCMFAVCTIFIHSLLGITAAVLSIGSIAVCVVGYLYFWNLDLDPASLCAILMSIGMSVDFTAHVIYSFLRDDQTEYEGGRLVHKRVENRRQRVINCVQSILFPMIQGGLSTVICVLPLLFIPDYIPLVFFKTIVLVVIFGLYHGLCVLPSALVIFYDPAERLSARVCNLFSSSSSTAAEEVPQDAYLLPSSSSPRHGPVTLINADEEAVTVPLRTVSSSEGETIA